MSDKYFNIDIDDPRAAAIAEVMSNTTSKKILSLLAEKEMSGSDIASELKMPLNTVGYNIEKLLKAGLVEKSKNFFWSVKGKKIATYKLSNKKILISPKKMISSKVYAFAGMLIGILILALLISNNQNVNINDSGSNNTLKNFNSNAELSQYIKDNTDNANFGFGYGGREMALAQGAPTVANALKSSDSASSYSQTNVQVAGVDEPDIVKNDGKYIYSVNGNKVVIVDAYPADGMKNVSELEFSSVQGIFVNGDKLVVFGNSYDGMPIPYGEDGIASETAPADAKIAANSIVACRYGYGGCGGSSYTNIFVYDISVREKPLLENNLSIEGNYISARMIGNYVYLISSKAAYSDAEPPIYYANGVMNKLAASDVYYYPEFRDSSFSFTTITSLNIDDGKENNKVYLTGYTGVVYVSENNIYLTYLKRLSSNEYQTKMINEAIIPNLEGTVKENVENIMNSDKNYYDKYYDVMTKVSDYSNSLNGKEKEEFDLRLEKSLEEFSIKMARENEKTQIMKIEIDKSNVELVASGEVQGNLLNQFSMDEYNGEVRVATTLGQSFGENMENSVFVLNENMDVIGELTGVAPGESIYSARFMGERAYLVTFKQVDPFFVIDLSDSKEPKVLGYLKIPGYSQYLHPYDENHVIGIGKDVNESIDADKVHSANAVYYTAIGGVKISLFDVSDVEHPKEVAKIGIGERGSESYALQDHKAFLFDKSKGILAIPITVNELTEVDYGYGKYMDSVPVWQGEYVLNINENDLSFRGRITHFDDVNASNPYALYDYQYQVQRALLMDDTIYTISQSTIKANDLESLEEISKIEMPSSYSGGPILY